MIIQPRHQIGRRGEEKVDKKDTKVPIELEPKVKEIKIKVRDSSPQKVKEINTKVPSKLEPKVKEVQVKNRASSEN